MKVRNPGAYRLLCAVFVLVCVATGPAAAQEFSERQEIAIFRLDYYGAPRDPVPRERTSVQFGRVFGYERRVESETTDIFRRAVGAVDEHIRSVFINLGRFDVIGLNHRLNADNVDAFIGLLRGHRERDLELPEEVLLGEEAFTEQDFDRLVGGFIIVIPSVSYYNVAARGREYEAEIETSFTFIDARDQSTIGQFFVTTSGSDENAVAAMRAAVNGIAPQLEYRLRSMDIFQLRSGVLDVAGRTVILELGRNLGVRRGDEFAIVHERRTPTGHRTVDETGMIVISDVREEFSIGRLLYSNPGVQVGDQLQEVPRYGIDVTPYGNLIIPLDRRYGRSTFVAGVKATASRGYFRVRPQAGFEVPFTGTLLAFLFPANVYVGAESNWYLGRLKLNPSFGVGFGGAVPFNDSLFSDDFYTTHVGGNLKLAASYLITRDSMLVAEVGFAQWFGLYDKVFNETVVDRFFGSYGGIVVGLGLTFK